MSFYLDHTSPSEWNLNDALKSYRSRFLEDDPEDRLKADLLKIKEKTTMETKRVKASKLLEQLNKLGGNENKTSIRIDSFTNTNNGQQSLLNSAQGTMNSSALPGDSYYHTNSPMVSNASQPSHGPIDTIHSYRDSGERNSKRTRPNDPIDNFFNPLPETDSSTTRPNDTQDNLLLPEVPLPLSDIECVHLGRVPELTYMVDNKDIASLFYHYKVKSKEIISKRKMFQETDLHELLALTHVLLLKPWEYSPQMLKIFDATILNHTILRARKALCHEKQKFNEEIADKLKNTLKEITDLTSTIDDIADDLNDLARTARRKGLPKETKIIRAIRNIVEMYPMTNMVETVPEMDLITSFLSPFLSPILSSRTSRMRWPNTKLDNLGIFGRPTSCRPDCIVSEMVGAKCTFSRAYGEVKSADSIGENYLLAKDLLRLGVFGKDGIDTDSMDGVMLYQAVGHTIIFYAISLASDGLYIMFELEKVTIPRSLKDIYNITSSLNSIMTVVEVCSRCAPSTTPEYIKDKQRDTLDTPHFRNIINTTKSKKRGAYVSFI